MAMGIGIPLGRAEKMREETNDGRGIGLRVSLWRREGRGDREEREVGSLGLGLGIRWACGGGGLGAGPVERRGGQLGLKAKGKAWQA